MSTVAQAKDDKVSMEQQEADGLAVCAREGWDVADVIRIPGYSRSFYTLAELVDAATADGELGPAKLQAHINARDFDVLVARSTNRFGREQSINAEVIGKIIRVCGARIYSQMDGMIDRQNYRAYIAITGYRDASEIDELVKKRAMGIRRRVSRGLPPSGRVPFSHRLVRNPTTGKDERVEVRAELRPLFRDVAELLLDGVAYDQLSKELYDRFGYVGDNGKPYPYTKFNHVLFSAPFWGHQVIRWKSKVVAWASGVWIFDPSVAPPDGVEMFYDTHEPMYTGELADQVKAELIRRTEVHNGPALHIGVKVLSGLCFCNACGWRSVYNYRVNRYGTLYKYLRCNNASRPRLGVDLCPHKGQLREDVVLAWLGEEIQRWLNAGRVVPQLAPQDDADTQALHELRARAVQLDARLGHLVGELALADEDLKPFFRRDMRATNDELNRVKEQAAALEARLNRQRRVSASQDDALERIRTVGLPAFFALDAAHINRELRALLGPYRIALQGKEVIGLVNSADF